MHDENHDDWDDQPSKSQVKRELAELVTLAKELVELPQKRLDQIPLDDDVLAEGIALARRITANSGKKRQIQFIGKRLRQVDTGPILKALNQQHDTDTAATEQHHQAEAWRLSILKEGQSAINAFIGKYPQAERTQIRSLWQQAVKETSQQEPPVAFRKLYRTLLEAITFRA
ncbi:MAG TPA: hypothetical protein DEO43_09160 [Halieaceae bacterium]|jgi:ribosome-associated protein|nr:hypothetical protein [Halieaceae bacterium]